MAKFVCFGEMLLRLSAPGKERLFQSPDLVTNFVGAEANVGVTLSRLGNDVNMVTAVPDNPIGKACEDALSAQGISTKHLIRRGPRLAVYYLETGALIRPSVITYDREHSSFALAVPSSYDWDSIFQGADFFHICGISLAVSENSYQASVDAVAAAKRHGVQVSFDCNYRAALWKGREERSKSQIASIISQADILFGGARDCNLLFDTKIDLSDPDTAFRDAASEFFDRFSELKIIAATDRTVRSSDSNDLTGLISTRDEFAKSQTFRLDGIVDRIGGGDAFAGGVLHKVGEDAELKDIISFGTASSAIKHSIPGDFNRTSVAEINALAQNAGLDVQR